MANAHKPEFTLSDVQEALTGLDVEDQHVVLASLSKRAEQRRAVEESEGWPMQPSTLL